MPRGFTLVEMLVAITLFVIVSGVGVANLGPAIRTARANSQAARVSGLIQLARENAIRTQRDLELTVDTATNTLRIVRSNNGVATSVSEVTLEYNMSLRTFAGVPDTPEGFGMANAADFGGAARLFFISDGSLVDEDSVPVNGTIALGVADQQFSARAITVTGTTARARRYRWMGGQWVAQ
jgi:prepilin-type N-terminal cleavage/methylation domain-containing protein